MKNIIEEKLELLGKNFEPFLYETNINVTTSLKKLGFEDDEIRRIELFDWFQGVGLYGYYKLYKLTSQEQYLTSLQKYYKVRIDDGLPAKNINSMAPMLTLIHLLDEGLVDRELEAAYWEIVKEWAQWLFNQSPRTEEGGFAHLTCEAANSGELWDDTLFMAVLFLAKAGIVLNNKAYVEEAIYQFFIHNKYLADKKSGFWFHGFTFDGRHNFVEAKWARGNSWITIFVPEFLTICEEYDLSEAAVRTMKNSWLAQVKGLIEVMGEDGLWPTLLDDPTSYSEASGSAGFLWGIQQGRRIGLLENNDEIDEKMDKAVKAILTNVTASGILEQVSGGTAMGKESLDFYKKIPLVPKPYGQAMAMGALIETMNCQKRLSNV